MYDRVSREVIGELPRWRMRTEWITWGSFWNIRQYVWLPQGMKDLRKKGWTGLATLRMPRPVHGVKGVTRVTEMRLHRSLHTQPQTGGRYTKSKSYFSNKPKIFHKALTWHDQEVDEAHLLQDHVVCLVPSGSWRNDGITKTSWWRAIVAGLGVRERPCGNPKIARRLLVEKSNPVTTLYRLQRKCEGETWGLSVSAPVKNRSGDFWGFPGWSAEICTYPDISNCRLCQKSQDVCSSWPFFWNYSESFWINLIYSQKTSVLFWSHL